MQFVFGSALHRAGKGFLVVAIGLGLAGTAVAAEIPLQEAWSGYGPYAVVNTGVGVRDTGGTGTMSNVAVSGQVQKAWLYWVGENIPHTDLAKDSMVTLTRSGSAGQSVTAETSSVIQFEVPWQPGNYYWDAARIAYWADVTDIVAAGTFDYTVSDFVMDDSLGVGLQIVYADETLPAQNLSIYQGHDYAFAGWQNAGELNRTNVVTYEFAPAAYDRILDAAFMLAGGEDQNTDRPDQLWYDVGTHETEVDLPAELITNGLGTVLDANPLNANSGNEWDTVTKSVLIPAGATYASFQFESGGGTGLGHPKESFSWITSSFSLVPEPASLVLLAFGAMAVVRRSWR
ncbi:MAG: PEP-CTERM sorting domain-containing protein [Phycisphaerae bacterium]|nr:PEP-CTERM sorting domain-containing protein [Phycisphaerae bacterium]